METLSLLVESGEIWIALGYYSFWYLVLGLLFTMVMTVITGYNLENWTKSDLTDIVLWPISLAAMIGLVIRIIVESTKKPRKTGANK